MLQSNCRSYLDFPFEGNDSRYFIDGIETQKVFVNVFSDLVKHVAILSCDFWRIIKNNIVSYFCRMVVHHFRSQHRMNVRLFLRCMILFNLLVNLFVSLLSVWVV